MRLLLSLIICITILSSCNTGTSEATAVENDSTTNSHKVIVKEVLQANAYTYLRVTENDQEVWMAVSKMDTEVGAELFYNEAYPMKDFKSKDLDRFFETILFVQEISDKPIAAKAQMEASDPHQQGMQKPIANKADIQIDPIAGGISIAELYKNRTDYEGKKVIIRGKAVKVNNGIMGQNWVHLQDGTADNGNFDLTITTLEEVNVGDVVTFEGTVVLNKDFGAGYSYELIIEGGILK